MKSVWRTFEGARTFVNALHIKNRKTWYEYCKSGGKPADIPLAPDRIYKGKGWIGWGDWLGTGYIAQKYRKFRPFEEAKNFVHSLGLGSKDEWSEYARSGKKPKDIPSNPDVIYKDFWKGWPDWLGYEEKNWSIKKVKELIKDLIKNNVIDEWSDDERYHLLFSKGVLNLHSRFSELLQDLVIGPKTKEQRKALEDFVNSDIEDGNGNIPDIGSEEIPILSTNKLAELVEEKGHIDPLEEEKVQTP